MSFDASGLMLEGCAVRGSALELKESELDDEALEMVCGARLSSQTACIRGSDLRACLADPLCAR